MKWIDIKKRIPQIRKNSLVSEDILFACADKKVDSGLFHKNGCFYGRKFTARTYIAEANYSIFELPKKVAVFWCKFPKAP